MIVKFKCEYNGKNFNGFQRLPKGRSVQGVLEQAFSKYIGQDVAIHGSGRTDAGVHAVGQVCSFELDHNICGSASDGLYKMLCAVNSFLDADVVVKDIEIAPKGFHARYSAKRKTYLYRVYVGRTRSPVRDDFYHQIYEMPNLNEATDLAKKFLGKQGMVREGVEREVYSFDIEQRGGDEIWFWVCGNGFLRKAVRTMVGEVLYKRACTVPAKGLTLWSVEY